MTWFKVDDGLADHPKMVALQQIRGWKGAVALWVLAGSWSSRHLTDGQIPTAIVGRLGCTLQDATALVLTGMWTEVDGGYQFHDWHACNPAKSDVESKRKMQRDRVAKFRGKRGESGGGNASCNALQDALPSRSVTPPPSRPVPTRPIKNTRPEDGHSSGRAREAGPASPSEPMAKARALLVRGYQRRYEAATGEPWMGASRAHSDIGTAAAWVVAKPDALEARVSALLDGAFADPWLTERRWPWGAIARDPAKLVPAHAVKHPDVLELERLDAALDAAERQGDYDAMERLRASIRVLAERRRRAS